MVFIIFTVFYFLLTDFPDLHTISLHRRSVRLSLSMTD